MKKSELRKSIIALRSLVSDYKEQRKKLIASKKRLKKPIIQRTLFEEEIKKRPKAAYKREIEMLDLSIKRVDQRLKDFKRKLKNQELLLEKLESNQ